ncbi:hypothetical protein GCM10007857_72660 [Bradyrhizobium iriomotense]|uniref:Uncharacterized protein n=1 Tax=Bradyrhizobium iriomotense TaxID=441950 RepID=A0ABQ6B9L3_9BRAD|nr:hypothetical protein GCM10007857_72660 [Bradyrhizobium iriomotense]
MLNASLGEWRVRASCFHETGNRNVDVVRSLRARDADGSRKAIQADIAWGDLVVKWLAEAEAKSTSEITSGRDSRSQRRSVRSKKKPALARRASVMGPYSPRESGQEAAGIRIPHH